MAEPSVTTPVWRRVLAAGWLAMLLAMVLVAAWQWRLGPPVSSRLTELLPQAAWSAQEQQAIDHMQGVLNRELLLLVSADDRDQGMALLSWAQRQLQNSALFEDVRGAQAIDLSVLGEQIRQGRLALLAASDRQMLMQQPEKFIAQRAANLLDPFAGPGLLPPAQDWLGLAQRIVQSHAGSGPVGLDWRSGYLLAEQGGRSWFMLHARSAADALDTQQLASVSSLLASVQQEVAARGGRSLVASGLLYAAQAQAQAAHEIQWLGGGALLGITLLLLLAFRRGRALFVFVPVLAGLLAGSVVCVAVWGNLQAMTLVVGSTLIGVASDYPLHYLSRCYHGSENRPWSPWVACRGVLPGLTLSLVTSLIGYLALSLTPFPALTQLALFCAAGLLAAYVSTVVLLPCLFAANRAPKPWPALLNLAHRLLMLQSVVRNKWRRTLRMLLLLLSAWLLAGMVQLKWHDDVRNWVAFPQELLAQAKEIAQITGHQPSSQFFLVQAADESQLLARLQALSLRLDAVVARGELRSYTSISQLLASVADQQRLRHALGRLSGSPHAVQPLLDLGVPMPAISAEVQGLQALADWQIDDALGTVLGEGWRGLWLGPNAHGVAAVVSLQGLKAGLDLSTLAQGPNGIAGVSWVDHLRVLNQSFDQTRSQAAWLKLLSYAAILLLLWPWMGLRSSVRMLAVPLLAVAASLAVLGWLGQPLTLFGLFGLLLVSAFGVDYAIFMGPAAGDKAAGLVSVMLAAISTMLSFGLLAWSTTPAVSSFGLCVAMGIGFCFLLAPWIAGAASTSHEKVEES